MARVSRPQHGTGNANQTGVVESSWRALARVLHLLRVFGEDFSMERPPAFKVLPRAEQPPADGYHVLVVHRISDDKRSVVHEISGRVPPSRCPFRGFTGEDVFTGSPGDALRMADGLATE